MLTPPPHPHPAGPLTGVLTPPPPRCPPHRCSNPPLPAGPLTGVLTPPSLAVPLTGVITAGVTRCLQSSSSTSSTTGQHQQPQCNTGDGSLADQFSRAVSAKPRRSAVFRTGENDPRQHTRRHEGMFYSVDGVEFDRWMRPTVNTFMITMVSESSSWLVTRLLG